MRHLIGSVLGRPTSVQRLLAKNTDIAVPISEISSIAESSVVPWNELGQACELDWFSSLQPGQLTGWGQNNKALYGALTLQCSALADLGSRELTQNWSCDITEIHGFLASKSVLTDFRSTDEMVETNSQEMISEISHKKLAENLSHTEIRIIHSHSPNSGDFFERYAWDRRIWLINAGGSHHTAAAKYIASRLQEPVTLTGNLYTNRLNPDAVLSLAQSFEMFLIPGAEEWFADFTDAMEDFKATWYWRPAPRQLGHSHLLFLPKTNKRSMAVAALLHKHNATDLSAHLLHLIDVQSQLASRKNHEVTGGQDLNKILVVVHPGSVCGSADFNLGPAAQIARDLLVKELNDWTGGLIIIDGELSDELPQYPALNFALNRALARAREFGYVAVRQKGDDPDQVEVIRAIVAQIPDAESAQFSVTGAWFHPEDSSGCVGSVIQELGRNHLTAGVCESALRLDPGEEDCPRAMRPGAMRG